MTSTQALLMAGFVPPDALTELENSYTLHRYFEAKDKQAFLSKIKDDIVCVVGTSHAEIPQSLINALPHLKQISIYGTGYEKIAVQAALDKNIVVTNTPDVMTNDVADLGMGLIFASVREIVVADRFVRADRSRNEQMPFTRSLCGLKLGILGLGKIGSEVAKRAQAFGMKVSYCGRQQQPDVDYPYFPDLKEMAATVDVLLLSAPGGNATYHIVTEAVLEKLGPEGILINIARGSLVDEMVLVNALHNGKIKSAALDVFADLANPAPELYQMENVILSPHRGSATSETRSAMACLMVANVDAGMRGEKLVTPIPECQ